MGDSGRSHPVAGRVAGLIDRRFGTCIAEGLRHAAELSRVVAPGRLAPGMLRAGLMLGLRPGRARRVRLAGPCGPLLFTLPDFSAYAALWEVFVGREYELQLTAEPRAILDLGANAGAATLFYRLRYPRARIVAVEANPALIPALEANVRSLSVEVVAAAVAVEPGETAFYAHEQSWHGSTALAHGPAVTVPAVGLDELIADDVDLVKIDVEGAEMELIPASERLAGVPAILGEVHAPRDSDEMGRVVDALEGFDVELAPGSPEARFTVFRAVRPGS